MRATSPRELPNRVRHRPNFARLLARVVHFATLAALHEAAGQGVALRGVVFDSLHVRPLAGAHVVLGPRTTTTDTAGRFAFLGVPPGSHHVVAQHEAVDRLGLSGVGARVEVKDQDQDILLLIPSFVQLWRIGCGLRPPMRDTGFVFGNVQPALSGRAITISASWIDITASRMTVTQKLRTLEVRADSLGNFTLCGVPTGSGLSIQALGSDSAASGIFDISPLDSERLVRRDLRLVAPSARANASLTGRVVSDSGGTPVPDAAVALLNTGFSTRSTARGEYRFQDLSPGTYRLHVRKIGYAESEWPVDVEAGHHRRQDAILRRVTLLDSVKVTGKPLARDEQMRVFEENRKRGLGKFLTAKELETARGLHMTTLVRQWPGIYINGRSDPVSRRGIKSIVSGGSCKISLYLDGVKLSVPLIEVAPETLAGVEYYPSPATTPVDYAHLNSYCGMMLLHSRYKTAR